MAATREPMIRAAGLALVTGYATFIGWLYASQPQTIAEVTGALTAAVGAYQIEATAFDDGLRYFRNDQFVEARAAFARADPAGRDARTQFYTAYTHYRQGWHRLYHDDEQFRAGLAAVTRAIALAADGRLVVDDPDLQMHTADELKAELEAGLTRDPSDFNPFRALRPRK